MSTASEHIAIIEDPRGMERARHCGRCGRAAGEDALIWTMERNERGVVWICPECTRRSLAAIEGGLDQAFWD